MKKIIFKGCGTAIVTPFNENGVNFDEFKRLIEFQISEGIDSIIVCGTTGWLDKMAEAEDICTQNNGAFFYASNFSVGVNVLFAVNKKLAELMNKFPEYDVTVDETHHTGKVDAPSGTAITLAQGILENCQRKESWVEGWTTNPTELGVASLRRGVVPGIHTVVWESEQDTITLSHSAKGRRGLAMGAVMAAEFVVGKKGVFSMNDLLGI